MAKRTPEGEVPYRPLDKILVQSVMAGVQAPAAVVESRSSVGEGNAAVAIAPAPSRFETLRGIEPSIPRAETPPSHPSVPAPSSLSEPVRRIEPPMRQAVESIPERRDREKRFLLTSSEEREIERLVDRVAGELNTPVKLSHMLRAAITVLLHAQEDIIERTRKVKLLRPGNGNAHEIAEFEKNIAQILAAAFRDTRVIR